MSTTFGHWINGRSTPARQGGRLTVHSPVDGSPVSAIASGTAEDVAEAVEAAAAAASAWRRQKPIERGRVLMRLAAAVQSQADELAALGCAETGKPAWQAPMEIAGAACKATASNAFCRGSTTHGSPTTPNPR
jgi:aldehyde dehydrogenase (NAD+)